jgi:Fe2+ transport system protein FeoA
MTQTVQLDQVQAGTTVRMLGFVRCRRSGLRLTEMGLTPGTIIEVLQAARAQPLLLRVRGSQLAIDRRTARKIKVEYMAEGAQIPGQGQHGWRGRGGRHRSGWGNRMRGWKQWRDPHRELIDTEGEERER